jgi:hypothetical protein
MLLPSLIFVFWYTAAKVLFQFLDLYFGYYSEVEEPHIA